MSMSVATQRGYESKTGGKVMMYRLWLIFLVTLALTTLIFAGSAVAQNTSASKVCLPDSSGQETCNVSSNPDVCIVGNATCDQRAQNPSAQNAPTVSIT